MEKGGSVGTDGEGAVGDAPRDADPDGAIEVDLEEVDLGELDLYESPFKEGPARPVEGTRARLAELLFWLLAFVIAGLLGLLATERLEVEEFADVTAVLVTPIVGLLGAATGYYYGRSDR